MIRSLIRQRIQDGINDPEGIFFTNDDAEDAIDEAMEVMVEEAGAIKRTAFLALQPATTFYWLTAIAPDVMSPWRIWSLVTEQRLTAVSMRQLDHVDRRWLETHKNPEVWFPVSWDLFGIWPTPSEGGGVLRVDYLAWPRALLDDRDEPEFQVSDTEAIVDYGIYTGLISRWDAARALQFWAQFNRRLGVSRDRTGVGRVQSRAFRVGQAEEPGFSSGVGP